MTPLRLTFVLILAFCSCAPEIFDTSPAATVSAETISRGFLWYTMGKASSSADAGTSAEVLNEIISTCLIAHKARELKIEETGEFRTASRRAVKAAGKDFICDMRGFTDSCDERLFQLLKKEYHLSCPDIAWERVFIIEERPFIPFGGKLPAASSGGAPTRSRAIDMDYAAGIEIKSDLLTTSLMNVLTRADDEQFDRLKHGIGRELLLKSILTTLHLNRLKEKLGDKERALLDEVELRTRETLLAGAYRRLIGFESISGGHSSAVRYPVSDREAFRFYSDNPRLFEEPASADLSHIRFRDFATAERVYGELLRDPDSFCDKVREHTIAGDAASCGHIGTVTRGGNLPLYKEFGFTMESAGQISRPFTTPDGVEILKLLRKTVSRRPWNAHTKKLAAQKLQLFKREQKLRETIEEMKQKNPVRIFK